MRKKFKYLIAIVLVIAMGFIVPLSVLYGAFFKLDKEQSELQYVQKLLHEVLTPMTTAPGEFSQEKKSWGSYKGTYIFEEEVAHFDSNCRNRLPQFPVMYNFKLLANRLTFGMSNISIPDDVKNYGHRFYQEYILQQDYFDSAESIDFTRFIAENEISDMATLDEAQMKMIDAYNDYFNLNVSSLWESNLGGRYIINAKTQETVVDENYADKLNAFNNTEQFEVSGLYFKTSDESTPVLLCIPYSKFVENATHAMKEENFLLYVKKALSDLGRYQKTANILLKSDIYGGIKIDFEKAHKYVEDKGLIVSGLSIKTQENKFLSGTDYDMLLTVISSVKDFKLINPKKAI